MTFSLINLFSLKCLEESGGIGWKFHEFGVNQKIKKNVLSFVMSHLGNLTHETAILSSAMFRIVVGHGRGWPITVVVLLYFVMWDVSFRNVSLDPISAPGTLGIDAFDSFVFACKVFMEGWGLPNCTACRILVPQLGIKPRASAERALSRSHWITREFPGFEIFF